MKQMYILLAILYMIAAVAVGSAAMFIPGLGPVTICLAAVMIPLPLLLVPFSIFHDFSAGRNRRQRNSLIRKLQSNNDWLKQKVANKVVKMGPDALPHMEGLLYHHDPQTKVDTSECM